jgi:hypothetical protein
MLTSYKNILQAIPENMFQPVSLKDKMLAKLWQGKNDICGTVCGRNSRKYDQISAPTTSSTITTSPADSSFVIFTMLG